MFDHILALDKEDSRNNRSCARVLSFSGFIDPVLIDQVIRGAAYDVWYKSDKF